MATMYIANTIAITHGEYSYSNPVVFTDLDEAKAYLTNELKKQNAFWHSDIKGHTVKGLVARRTITSATGNMTKTYELRVINN